MSLCFLLLLFCAQNGAEKGGRRSSSPASTKLLTHLKAICNNTALRFFSLYPPPTRYLFRLQDGVSQEEKKTPSTPCVHLLFALHIIDVFGSLVPKMTFFFFSFKLVGSTFAFTMCYERRYVTDDDDNRLLLGEKLFSRKSVFRPLE